jgi:hypothetical protein
LAEPAESNTNTLGKKLKNEATADTKFIFEEVRKDFTLSLSRNEKHMG